ncbi:type IV pilus assembly protein PilM [Candidatus Nomurabacteria bacterium]|nr:type IV pilus assembly protein PilM [Candidatus Nomurabacteria bacterium]
MSSITDLFSSASSSLGTLFTKKPQAILGIDIGASSIKLVELKKDKGVLTLGTYGEVALGPYAQKEVGVLVQSDPDIIAQALIDVLKESHSTATHAIISIQSSASLVFVIQLPMQALSSLDSVVPNEARKYIPVPLSEVSLNWNVVPDHIQHRYELEAQENTSTHLSPSNERDILVAAIRNDALSGYRNIIAQAGLTVQGMEIEIFSILRSLYHHELTPFAIVDIGASGVRIAIVHYGMVMQYDVAVRGSESWTQSLMRSLDISFTKAEELKRTVGLSGTMSDVVNTLQVGVSRLLQDIRTSIQKYEQTHHVVVDHIILSGGGARMPGLLEHMKSQFDVAIQQAEPFEMVDVPGFLGPVLESVGPEFACAVGAALKGFNG